jgi:RNase P/RNase MRP subunit p29
MLTIATKDSALKRIPKRSVVLELSIPENGKIQIPGANMVGRPENRVKKKR